MNVTSVTRRLRTMGPRVASVIAAFVAIAVSISGAAAQSVRLELRPHVGDTLMLRIEQQTEVVRELLMPGRDSTKAVRTSMVMFARAIVERSDGTTATVLAVTDSVSMTSTAESDSAMNASEKHLEDASVRMKLFPDGASSLVSPDGSANPVIRAIFAEMPANLPRGAVKVGSTWTREVALPLDGGGNSYTVTTTFRLDSLSNEERMAYISMQGLVVQAAPKAIKGSATGTTGDMHGRMTLDRLRGWIIDSIATITINAVVRRPVESILPDLSFQIRITQEMRTLNQR